MLIPGFFQNSSDQFCLTMVCPQGRYISLCMCSKIYQIPQSIYKLQLDRACGYYVFYIWQSELCKILVLLVHVDFFPVNNCTFTHTHTRIRSRGLPTKLLGSCYGDMISNELGHLRKHFPTNFTIRKILFYSKSFLKTTLPLSF